MVQNYGYLAWIYHRYKELPKKKEDIKVAHRSPTFCILKGINLHITIQMCISFLSLSIEESIPSKKLNLSVSP